jgi:hypothetical protein
MMWTRSVVFILLLLCALKADLAGAEELLSLKKATFDMDPCWGDFQNHLNVTFPPRVLQDFGYRTTNLAGKAPGEMGGYIQSSVRPAHYAKQIEPLSMDTPLSFSGSFALMEGRAIMSYHTLCETFIGFFNSAEQGYRPKNFMGFRLMGTNEPDGVRVEVTYTTRKRSAGGTLLEKGGSLPKTGLVKEMDGSKMLRIAPDGQRHEWTWTYNPKGKENDGEIVFTLDGVQWMIKVLKAHQEAGAEFNRFGIFNEQLPGRAMVVYFDDMSINGRAEEFSKDPGWEGVGNHEYFDDPVLYGSNDFGFSATHYAGGQPGEIGGRLWRVDKGESHLKGWYGVDTGNLTLNDTLEAHGKIAFRRFCIDSGMHIGFFNSKEQGWPPRNFVGVNVDSLSRVGLLFMPMYGTREGAWNIGDGELSPCFVDDGNPLEFSIVYDPQAEQGLGALTVRLGDQTTALPLKPGEKEQGAAMNRFGIFNMQDNNGKYCEVYIDDIEYTSR